MTKLSGVTIGVALSGAIADILEAKLVAAGYDTCRGLGVRKCGSLPIADAEHIVAWVFDPADEAAFEAIQISGAYLLPAENPPSPTAADRCNAWCAILLEQLEAANLARPDDEVTPGWSTELSGVWLLAGSAGATTAIQHFFKALRSVPPVGFIYAQHFDPSQQHQLYDLDLDNADFELRVIDTEVSMAPGLVCMVPPSNRVIADRFGTLRRLTEAWGKGHSPHINDLMIMLAASGLTNLGVIVFSGMGTDASEALDVFDSVGARIWTQSLETAICEGMPRAACATGLVHRTGSPEQLAEALSSLYLQSS
ncbi:MAG: chemotaxis protein CheB [Halioglobus sp.]